MRVTSLLLVFAFFGLASCRSLKDPVFNGVGDLAIQKVALGGSTLTANLYFFNPNMAVKLKRANGTIWLDGALLGEFVLDTAINIPARSDFQVPVSLDVDMKNLLRNSLSAILSDSITFRIEGEARLGKGGLYKTYPVRYKGKQNLDDLINGVNGSK